MKKLIRLEQCSRTDPKYVEIRNRHYVANHGCIGRQLHYLVYIDGIESPIGIISGASAVWACKPRDDFFNITTENRIKVIGKIINNVVFRLELNEKNLGSQILSLWRKRVVLDWKNKYNDEVIGFETFIFGENRFGSLYKADNWIYQGETKGSAKFKPHGAYGKGERLKTDIKMIFCKKLDK